MDHVQGTASVCPAKGCSLMVSDNIMLGFHNKHAFSTPMFPIDSAHHQGFPLLWFADDTFYTINILIF
jgi:hypothetical protein